MLHDPIKSQRALDPRPARTRAAILNAIQRLGARGVELTIATIVEEAGLSRSSFYSQFKDLGDVVVQLFQGLQDRVMALDSEEFENINDPEAAMASYRLITAELQKHRALYAAVLSATTTSETHLQLTRVFTKTSEGPAHRAAPPGIDPDLAALYIGAGTLAVLVAWLHAENPQSEAEVHRQLLSLVPAWMFTDTSHEV